jgi:recombination protein RecT
VGTFPRAPCSFPRTTPLNALKAAALLLPEVKNKDGIPVLKSCTADSIKGALLSMCVQGLNPNKHQCYFIAYGEHLALQRSYFGDIGVAKQVDPSIEDIFASVVFEGDKFEYTIKRGKIVEINHSQKLENKNHPIVAAYATVVYQDGREISQVMTWPQIVKAWTQSPTHPVGADGKIDPKSTHGKFPEEMAKKTVIHRVCKPIIDSSSDESLLIHYAKQTDDAADAAEADEDEAEHANREYIDTDEVQVGVDPETGEVAGETANQQQTAPAKAPANKEEAEPF